MRLSPAGDGGQAGPGEVRIGAVVTETIYLGTGNRVHLRTDDGLDLVALEQSTASLDERADGDHRGDRVTVRFARADVVLLSS
nr:TOBE domain-containing protein [Nocardioides convexus]